MGNCTTIFTVVDLRIQNSFPNTAIGPASYFFLHDNFPSYKNVDNYEEVFCNLLMTCATYNHSYISIHSRKQILLKFLDKHKIAILSNSWQKS